MVPIQRAARLGAAVAVLAFAVPRAADAQCAPAPIAGCRPPAVAQKAQLLVKKYSDDNKDKLQWKYVKGASTTKEDFGILTSDTDYFLCVYDGTSTLLMTSFAEGGGSCHEGVPCWKETSTGYKYKDADNSPNGPYTMLLKAGTAGIAKIVWKGKGSDLDPPTPPLSQPVTVQLVNSNGVCWEAVYSEPAIKNVGGLAAQFKDKAD